MGLLETEIKELRNIIKKHDGGEVTDEQVQTKIALYSQIEKRARLMLQAFATVAKYKRIASSRIISSNLIGDGTAIDITPEDQEKEKVKCKIQGGGLITRAECLDLSGLSENYGACKDCENCEVTKDLLLN